MTRKIDLDCIVIGPCEVDFQRLEEKLTEMGSDSAAYRVLQANSVCFKGRRMSYMHMWNRMLAETTGRPHHFNVYELPNLAVYHLKSFLSKQGFHVEIVNFFNHEKQHLVELLARDPKAVAITTTFYVDNDPVVEIVDFIRQHNPKTKIIVGGPHIYNICSDYTTQTQDFTFKMVGADIYIYDFQGEQTLAHVLRTLRDGHAQNLQDIPNLIYTVDGVAFQRTRRRGEELNINECIVDWDLFDKDHYTPTVQLRTAKSCSFSCAFCQYPIIGGKVSFNDLTVIERQLRFLKAMGVQHVIFNDDTFNVPLSRFKKICRMMIANAFHFNWFSFFRCSHADAETYELMRESGCKGVFLGIESGDQQILQNMNKAAKIEKYKDGIRKLNELGIITFVSLIVGFPGETQETIKNTIAFMAETKPMFYRAELYYHYTNTPIHQHANSYGIRGSGYHWQHSTMDCQEACDWVDVMHKTLKDSSVFPGYMFDFWAIPYLMGKGISIKHITHFVRMANSMP